MTLNIRDFGAVGDGETNDQAALQRAIDAAGPGDAVLIPAGVYGLEGCEWSPVGECSLIIEADPATSTSIF
jgi:hypothetical protein